ncbi:SufD family Fe-S cluster assembly protein [Athalassotoga saccharophila]|uniref:SufD family Fe-S cluster assembly protein n=1 Tax=Athalassotoga saccharophila TaxID=1441386 RepID=UPI001E51E7CF|nr:SufD family Fe-S cluster assembly protein [Athalassotoga saccharophila]
MFTRVEPKRQSFTAKDYGWEDIPNKDESFYDLLSDYLSYDFPVWKRLEFSEFKKYPIKKYSGNFVKNGKSILTQDAIKTGLKDFITGKFNGVDPKFVMMALIFFNSGIFSKIDKNEKIDLEYNLKDNNTIIENSGLILEENSSVVMVRSYRGEGEFLNSASKFLLKTGSRLKIFNVIISPKTDLVVSSSLYNLEESANLEVYDVIFGGQKTAIDHTANLNGDFSKATFKTVYFARGKERIDLRTSLNHFGRSTYGRIETNGSISDEGYSVVRGNIEIKHTAIGSDSEERSNTVSLSKKARADSIPSLYVDNNDVIAKHGASVGNIDEDKLYYLMSRGLDERSAIRLIVSGIFEPVINEIPLDNSNLKEEIEDAISVRI